MRTWVKIVLAVLFFILCVVFVFVYTRGFNGRAIHWDTQELQDKDFSQGLPDLSPSTLPEDGPLNTRDAVPEACNAAQDERDRACDNFTGAYPTGCHWWHFRFISSCWDQFALCQERQKKMLTECQIA